MDGSGSPVRTIFAQNDPFLGTAALDWLEMY
jgi:hypothetical protein